MAIILLPFKFQKLMNAKKVTILKLYYKFRSKIQHAHTCACEICMRARIFACMRMHAHGSRTLENSNQLQNFIIH
jgi:hypothetical protein